MKKNPAGTILILTLTTALVLLLQQPFTTPVVNLLSQGTVETEDEEQRALFVRERWKHEFLMLRDPQTGTIPAHIRQEELKLARSLPVREYSRLSGIQNMDVNNTYLPGGPNNSGGRTRAVAFDMRNSNIIISGSVSGGIMRSTDGGNNWIRVSPDDDIHNLTSLAQDPRPGNQDTWYAGGGEPIANSASGAGAFFLGYGIWKSTNNGQTWVKLTRTVTDINGSTLGTGTLEGFDNPLDMAHKIVVNPANGDVYVAAHRRIIRSTNGGTNWNVVLAGSSGACSDNGQTDILCTFVNNTPRFYAAINGGNPDAGFRGIWTSTTGNVNSWTRIAGGSSLGVDSVDGWRANSYVPSNFCQGTFISKRIVMGLAPSNQNILYVTYENGDSQSGASGKNEADLFKLTAYNGIFRWTNLSANVPDYPGQLDGVDPFHIQEGYDLMVVVKPNDSNTVFLGGVNLYRSTNGFTSTTSTAWIGGYGSGFAAALNIYGSKNNGNDISQWSHPDMHALVFDPFNPNRAICANDGGLQLTENIMDNVPDNGGVEPVSWTVLPNYQTLQYYHVAMDPGEGRNSFLGGAQDNGTRFRDDKAILGAANTGNAHYRLLSGDGGAAAIARKGTSSQLIYASSQFGSIVRGVLSSGSVTGGSIRPNGLTTTPGLSSAYGDFVTYFKIDFDNNEDLYYVNFNRLFRTTSASTVSSSSWTELTGVGAAVNPGNATGGTNISITALELSRGDYFPSHVLYIGTSDGRVLRLNNPRNAVASLAPTDITPSLMDGYVSDIAVNPNNDEEIMVTISNYNTPGVFWTKNAKSANPTWYQVEGNLTTPSYRSCMIVVKKDASNNPVTEYYVGTSVGLYSCTNIATTLQNNGSVSWTREGGSVINFAVITSMDYRPQDNYLLIGTHGNGLYYAQVGTPDFRPNQNTTGINDPVRNDKKFIQAAFPTLAREQVWFQTGDLYTVKRLDIRIYTASGQLVARKQTGYYSGTVDTRSLPAGSYILTITSDDYTQQFVRKFMKQ